MSIGSGPVDEFVSPLALTRGAGLLPQATGNTFTSRAFNAPFVGDHIEFGLTIAPGRQAKLDKLFIGTRSSAPGPGTLGLFHSGDGYQKSLFTFNQPGLNTLYSVIDLSAMTLPAGNTTFRIRPTADTNAGGSGVIAPSGLFHITDYFVDGSETNNFSLTGVVSAAESDAVGISISSTGVPTITVPGDGNSYEPTVVGSFDDAEEGSVVFAFAGTNTGRTILGLDLALGAGQTVEDALGVLPSEISFYQGDSPFDSRYDVVLVADTTGSGPFTFAFDLKAGSTVSSIVAIPEPAAASLLPVAGLVLAGRRRC